MKILLIEDELIWQLKFRRMIDELGGDVVGVVDSAEHILQSIEETHPDLIVSDIMLNETSIFSIFSTINGFNIPTIFITNHPSQEYYEQTRNWSHTSLLIKPFHSLTLKSTIDLLVPNYLSTTSIQVVDKGIMVRGKHNIKLWIKEENIWWIYSSGNYCFVQTATHKHVIKGSLAKLIPTLSDITLQIHRSYLINLHHVQKIELTRFRIFVHDHWLPIGRRYKSNVAQYLQNTISE